MALLGQIRRARQSKDTLHYVELHIMVITGQTAPRNGFSEADAGISNPFVSSMTSFG
jgi:hypothetical protein